MLEWLESELVIRNILSELRAEVNVKALVEGTGYLCPIKASSPKEVAAIGLHIMELCRSGKHFALICKTHGIRDGYSKSSPQTDSDAGFNKYILPFLEYVKKKLLKESHQFSTNSLVEARLSTILSVPFQTSFPETYAHLEKVSREFLRSDKDTSWFNIGNSCREALKTFSSELKSLSDFGLPDDIKASDVKGYSKYVLNNLHISDRYRDSLSNLMAAVWDLAQAITHRKTTSKHEALRLYLWTALGISEILSLLETEGKIKTI